jgi:hypothetical protein
MSLQDVSYNPHHSHLQMELNYGKTPNKWVDMLSMIHMELIIII